MEIFSLYVKSNISNAEKSRTFARFPPLTFESLRASLLIQEKTFLTTQ
jgi:hypothetical protein